MDNSTKCPMCGEVMDSNSDRCLACGETFLASDEPDPGTYLQIGSLLFALAGIVWAFAVDSDPLGMIGALAFVGIAISSFIFCRFVRHQYRRRQVRRAPCESN
jgi:hypothetical protein